MGTQDTDAHEELASNTLSRSCEKRGAVLQGVLTKTPRRFCPSGFGPSTDDLYTAI